MSTNKAHHGHGNIRLYLWVFFGLIIGTIITVLAWTVHFTTLFLTVLVALVIAAAKASLVAGWFMHLASEQRMIYAILGITAFFFLGMMFLTIWAMNDIPRPIFP
ncbi:MAG: cytochrome C oxidase subunit IV family protein [Verrucomicrobiae bacterium]|nr:cytochrome C oxidase subunit IV family protein [Verrucomicrobiae bacterium]